MNTFTLINRAIDQIEANLRQSLTVASIAAAVGYSRFHFTRLFQATAGMTVRTYIRRRRLHEAARDLLYSQQSVLEIALEYQFESPEAFTRAFKRMFGLNPSLYRRRGRFTRRFPRIVLRQPHLLNFTFAKQRQSTLFLASPNYTQLRTVRLHGLFFQRTFTHLTTRQFDDVLLYFA